MLLEGFSGIYPAAVSPRDAAGAFSVAAFEKLMHRLYGAGVQGVYVCGNTGEGYLMSTAERKLAAEVAVAASAGRGKVVVHVGAQQIGFVVDQLIGQEEVVIKPLGALLHGTQGMAGATITGDGKIALILDVPSLMKAYA